MSKKTSKTSTPTKGAKPAAAKTPREQKYGVTRSGEGTMYAKVWLSVDGLKTGGKKLTFEDVRELAGKEMANAAIRTQRQRWNVFNG